MRSRCRSRISGVSQEVGDAEGLAAADPAADSSLTFPAGNRFLCKYQALVWYYSEEGAGCGCGVRGAAFLCTTNRGKLLQSKLIRVRCTKKSTRVPVSPVPQYGYSV